jgi:uncharacterized protein
LLTVIREQPHMQLFTSTVLLEELADVLTPPAATKRLATIGKSAREVLADYVEVVELVEPIDTPRVVPDDPDDDHVLACALAAHADLIVSGDKQHLLSLGPYQGIAIVAPAEAMQIVSK